MDIMGKGTLVQLFAEVGGNPIELDLYAKTGVNVGTEEVTSVYMDYSDGKNELVGLPGLVMVVWGDASDPFVYLLRDGKMIAGFYGSYRASRYQCSGVVVHPDGLERHYHADNLGYEEGWVEGDSFMVDAIQEKSESVAWSL
jgi:hypothetical protein